jgi:hypothetical protein
VLTQLDLLALALVCTAVADALAAASGKKELKAALGALSEFGATPSSRTRVTAVAENTPDALAAFLARRPGAS